MKLILAILSLCIATSAYAETLNEFGQRSKACKDSKADGYEVKIPDSLKKETQELFAKNQLKQIILEAPNCFRVGTEIKLFLENAVINYLGRGFITRMEIMSKSQLKQENLTYSNQAIGHYIKETKSSRYAVINMDITEKVSDSFVNTKYGRLNTCFPAYGDWKTYRLPAGNEGLQVASSIKSGKKTAHIWNGTFNCYKVGTVARLAIPKDRTTGDLGSIIPTELHLVHYTHLTDKHAALVGEKLSDLKKRMAEKKEIDGGYTTIVVFNYLEPRVKDTESEKSEETL